MPCDTLRYQQIDFKNANLDVLRGALDRAGLTVYNENAERGYLYFRDKAGRVGQFGNGQFTIPEGINVDEIKREYSNEAAERAAKKFGFSIKGMKATDKGKKFLMVRRAY